MEESSDSVVILAAGVGSRLNSSIPKVFHRIGGLSLINHVINAAKRINPVEIIVVLNQKHENIELGSNIKKAYQNTQSGTADAVICGLQVMQDNDEGWVYILYGDIPLISSETLSKLSDVSKKCERTAVVVLAMDSSDTKDLGKLELAEDEGTIKSIIEAKDMLSVSKKDQITPLCNAGLFVKKKLLKQLINKIKPSEFTGEFYITDVVRLAYEEGYVCRYYEGDKKELHGVNTRSELALLEKIFQNKERQRHMDNGVTLVSPETIFFSYDTNIENDVIVYPYVVFMEGVNVNSGAQIGPFCVIDGTTIGNAKVGPFSRLRTGTEIHNDAKIGNFVEIKNSIISEKTKVNHLSYIGDASIGVNANIGAGTITCNYDGVKKNKTVIGNDVFVGSNTALVAPVKIADKVMIGAGSVITKDVEEGDLAITRSDQRNIKNWYMNFRRHKKCVES